MNSDEDAFYISSDDISEGAVEYSGGGYDDDDDDVAEEEPYTITKKPYTILNEETLKHLQENDISQVSNLLAVTRGVACALLLRKKWHVESVLDEWFADEDKVRKSVGISANKEKRRNEDEEEEEKQCLRRCLFRSYVESSRTRRWCPGPGCELAAEFDVFVVGGGGEETSYDVTCDCGFKFCWRCGEEHHRPVACATVARWAEKNASEEETASWIAANTKTCPGCKRKIEKIQGCANHMTCKCGEEFCWNCMQKWKNGYSHVCNEYFREKETAIEASFHEARLELRRYAFYYDRWASNHKSREIARVKARGEHLVALAAAQGVPETALEFVPEAWEQIVECRRVLKWSYVYGYYLKAEKKKGIFECLQGQAEESLERLHRCAEKEAAGFVGPDAGSWREFDEFKMKLVNLTMVTKKFFENLVRALENDLSEVGVA
ncbi:probable E3 ubiquitin-protein ligase ARI5 [Salvia miltiorrhiza]|uniref:probable E3 ubiquitin-protein ligase ARI5 n=1 Tax=Salvia miltiorrhiza TaxID=226208 RepID=UPI0025AD7557|nr:probable E3 ubiquitin-protein ligase ARI5 [Salvia miltiorrhiza]